MLAASIYAIALPPIARSTARSCPASLILSPYLRDRLVPIFGTIAMAAAEASTIGHSDGRTRALGYCTLMLQRESPSRLLGHLVYQGLSLSMTNVDSGTRSQFLHTQYLPHIVQLVKLHA